MPLSFESINHGSIAFGFFNIESDLLLLENNFIFADEFCKYIMDLADTGFNKEIEAEWKVWQIPWGPDMGDLMGAMHGLHYSGFFGELYRKYPFPASQIDFKQKPDGWKTQGDIKEILAKYGRFTSIRFCVDAGGNNIRIGDYAFTKTVFKELIRYVWVGGYPKWKDGEQPSYVADMMASVTQKKDTLFNPSIKGDN